jgi:hypothetical protein
MHLHNRPYRWAEFPSSILAVKANWIPDVQICLCEYGSMDAEPLR